MKKRDLELVVISDVHLGTYGCNAAELNDYLNSINPKTLVLNGDIIDIWQFNKSYFPQEHMETIKLILDFMSQGVKVYYVTGNHDELLRKFSDFKLGNLEIVDKLILNIDGQKTWIFHGDIFDLSINCAKWLAKLGGKSYDWMIIVNRWINFMLTHLGRERVSLSKKIKNSVKRAVKYVSDFETIAAQHAINQQYNYVICGHIHQPQHKVFRNDKGSVTYLNSGDWIENLTSLEYNNGAWSIFAWNDDVVPAIREIMLPTPEVENSLPQNIVA